MANPKLKRKAPSREGRARRFIFSVEPSLLDEIKKRSASLNLSAAQYVVLLVRQDLGIDTAGLRIQPVGAKAAQEFRPSDYPELRPDTFMSYGAELLAWLSKVNGGNLGPATACDVAELMELEGIADSEVWRGEQIMLPKLVLDTLRAPVPSRASKDWWIHLACSEMIGGILWDLAHEERHSAKLFPRVTKPGIKPSRKAQ